MSTILLPVFVNRRQSVSIANHISPTKELHYGAPQGSVLGPILFVLYIQPLSKLIKRHSLSVHLLADDIKIETSILPQHVHSAISSLETWIYDIKNLIFHLDTMSHHSQLLQKTADSILQIT